MEKCYFDNGRKCIALTSRFCTGCSFFKTEQQFKDGRKMALERIKSIPDGTKLLEKYGEQRTLNGNKGDVDNDSVATGNLV